MGGDDLSPLGIWRGMVFQEALYIREGMTEGDLAGGWSLVEWAGMTFHPWGFGRGMVIREALYIREGMIEGDLAGGWSTSPPGGGTR